MSFSRTPEARKGPTRDQKLKRQLMAEDIAVQSQRDCLSQHDPGRVWFGKEMTYDI